MSKLKAVIVIGLGYGDEGKGTVVDSLVQRHNSKLVIRYNGGFQAAHNVYQGNIHHTFAQFGSGTLSNAKTLLGRDVIINPLSMQVEAQALEAKGVKNPLNLVYVQSACIIATPFHRALNCVRELSRRRSHGSTGTGIGEARRMSMWRSDLTLRARQIIKDDVEFVNKLIAIREYCQTESQTLIFDYDLSGPELDKAMEPFNVVQDVRTIYDRYLEWAAGVKIIGGLAVTDLIAEQKEPVIFEGAQGILLDQTHGFHPYTTWSDITIGPAVNMLAQIKADYEPKVVGITRTFATRHGAGPLVTESYECKDLIKDDDNDYGRFQGDLRVGHLDLMTLKYAASVVPIDYLAVTHCDKLSQSQTHTVCVGYEGAQLAGYHCVVEAGQQALKFTKALLKTKPLYANVDNVVEFLAKELAVPVVITSYGKQAKDKLYAK